MSLAEREAFDLWRADPLNQRALDRMYELWGELSGLKTLDRPVAPISTPRRVSLMAAAAVIVALMLTSLGGLLYVRDRGTQVATGIGQQETRSLPDGSVMALNVDTSLRYRMRPDRRIVSIENGQAAFFVKKDKARPFVVDAGDYEVRAVGTAFDVSQRDGAMVVSVSEGVVALSATRGPNAGKTLLRLAAGQRMRTSAVNGGSPLQVSDVPIEGVAEWRLRVVNYEDATLASIVADLNRFFQRPLTIADARLGARRVTMRLDLNDRETTVRTLVDLLGIRLQRGAQGDVLADNSQLQ